MSSGPEVRVQSLGFRGLGRNLRNFGFGAKLEKNQTSIKDPLKKLIANLKPFISKFLGSGFRV